MCDLVEFGVIGLVIDLFIAPNVFAVLPESRIEIRKLLSMWLNFLQLFVTAVSNKSKPDHSHVRSKLDSDISCNHC